MSRGRGGFCTKVLTLTNAGKICREFLRMRGDTLLTKIGHMVLTNEGSMIICVKLAHMYHSLIDTNVSLGKA